MKKPKTLAELQKTPITPEEQREAQRKFNETMRAQLAMLKSPGLSDIGRNIDKLRKESGWSYDRLALESQLSKSLIFGHVQGRPVTPRIIKIYAQTFSTVLGRTITPDDLTGK